MVFIKPENALKKANDFIEVGKKERALDALYEVIKSKRHRVWQKIHEPIMEKYLELCVELKESHMAKDGLHQYKTICQNVNVKSLEDVIVRYLTSAEEKANKARKNASDAVVVVDVDDLENLNSPESLLLKAVSGESSQDRADRDVLAPWLKFVWESYKQCLDLLKNNNKLELLYAQVAKQAFQFCHKYQRKTEFRKLCETMRLHMAQSQRYLNQPTSIDLNKPETQSIHLETRLNQLNFAITMDLWQEAYKAVEDIYGLMTLSKTRPKPSQMFNYYSKLSLVFWKAGNHLFHAATLHKLFVLLKEQKKNIHPDELAKISTRVLLATLSIPITPSRSPIDECLETDEITIEKSKRLSALLSLQTAPTRTSLLRDLVKYNLVHFVYPEVRELYQWLEIEFGPLKLSERVAQCLEYIEKKQEADFSQYVAALRDINVMRLLKQVAQIYTSIELKRFQELAPAQLDMHHLEKLIVDSVKTNNLEIRINHQTKSLHFGNDLYVGQRSEDVPEGPSIQGMPSEQIRTQLIAMSQALQGSVELINRDELVRKRGEASAKIADLYRQLADRHHQELLKRKGLIEAQKEHYERLAFERETHEQNVRDIEEKKRKDEEEKRRKTLLEDTRKQAELNALKDMGKKAGVDLPGFEDKDEQEAKQKQIDQLKKEKREMDDKLKKEEKKVDHFIRACHEVELPMLEEAAKGDAQERKDYWEKMESERIENLKKERDVQAENRDRLLRMVPDKTSFFDMIGSARRDDFKKKQMEFSERLLMAREAKLTERRDQRKADRRARYMKEIEDRKRKEEAEKKARDDEERRRRFDEVAEKQRQRDAEVEKKQREREAPSAAADATAAKSKEVFRAKAPAPEENAWRREQPVEEREVEREAPKAREPYRPRHMRDDEVAEKAPISKPYKAPAQREIGDAWRRNDEPSARGAGARESGTREFGARDTGARDSGARDFGARDSGARDFGARDSGARDFGARDSGARDFGARDSGARDFGARDSGAKDSGAREWPKRDDRDRGLSKPQQPQSKADSAMAWRRPDEPSGADDNEDKEQRRPAGKSYKDERRKDEPKEGGNDDGWTRVKGKN